MSKLQTIQDCTSALAIMLIDKLNKQEKVEPSDMICLRNLRTFIDQTVTPPSPSEFRH